jgi:hypothetical protein
MQIDEMPIKVQEFNVDMRRELGCALQRAIDVSKCVDESIYSHHHMAHYLMLLSVTFMSNPTNPSQSPQAQPHREYDTGKAEPPSSLVTLQQRLGTLLVFVLGFVRDVCCDDGHEA